MDNLRNKIQLGIIGLDLYSSETVDIQFTKEELNVLLSLIDNS